MEMDAAATRPHGSDLRPWILGVIAVFRARRMEAQLCLLKGAPIMSQAFIRSSALAAWATVSLAISTVSAAEDHASPTSPAAVAAKPGPWVPSAETQAALAKLMDQAIALGFPDAAGCSLHYGELILTTPGQEPQPIKGLHGQRPDGSWLVLLAYVPAAGVVVDATKVQPTKSEDLLALARREQPWLDETALSGFLEEMKGLAPEARDMIRNNRAGMAVLSLNQQALMSESSPDSILGESVTQAVAWQRLAVPEAASAVIAFCEAALFTTEPGEALLDLDGSNAWAGMQRRQLELQDASKRIALPAPEAALRLGIFQWFRQQVIGGDVRFSVLSAERAAAGALAFADATDVRAQAQIRQLLTRAALPTAVPAGADLATRLVTWRSRRNVSWIDEEQLQRCEAMSDDERKNLPQPIKDALAARKADGDFTPQDLDALVALAGDRRLSRWLDAGQPRTVGDQALRAIASVVNVDSRILIKHDPQAPWNDAERDAVARDLATWWAANRQKPAVDLVADVVATMPLPAVAALVEKTTDPTQRAAWFDRLAMAWVTLPVALQRQPTTQDDNQDTRALATLLRLGKDHERFAATVDAWPVAGSHRLMLATWQTLRGKRQPLDDYFSEVIGKPIATTAAKNASLLGGIISVEASFPTSLVLQQVQVALSGPLDQEPAQGIMRWLIGNGWWGMEGQLVQQWSDNDHQVTQAREQKAQTFRLALTAQLLMDQRLATKDLITQATASAVMAEMQGKSLKRPRGTVEQPQAIPPERPVPTDLRVADCLATSLQNWSYVLRQDGEDWNDFQHDLRFDLKATKAERDVRLKALMERITEHLRKSLPEAGLPFAIPGVDLKADAGDNAPAF